MRREEDNEEDNYIDIESLNRDESDELISMEKLIYQRLWSERQLLLRQRFPIFLSLFVLLYGALILFRNLAFYRYRAGPRLKDLGHELFSEFSPQMLPYSDVPMILLNVVVGIVLIGSLLGPKILRGSSSDGPYFVNIVRRMICVFAMGHVMRACCYLATSVPGASDICVDGAHLHPPKTITECFTRVSSINGNCGDLIFSGHILFVSLAILCTVRYGAEAWDTQQYGPFHSTLIGVACTLGLIQAVCVLKARHHYSVDIVVASFIVPLLWYFYNHEIQKYDMEIDQAKLRHDMSTFARMSCSGKLLVMLSTCSYLFIVFFALLVVTHGNFKWLGFK